MDRFTDLVLQLEPETFLPREDVHARQRAALLRSVSQPNEASTVPRWWHPRHGGWFVAAVGAAAVVVVAVIAIPRLSPTPPPSTVVPDVLTAISTALANTGNDIEEVQTALPGSPLSTTSWVDLSTGACRTDMSLNGRPTTTIFVEQGKAVFIDRSLGEWWTRGTEGVTCQPLTPQVIEGDLAAGHYTVAAHTTFDGRPALELLSTSSTTGPHSETQLTTLWVDATTYLPIQSTSTEHTTEHTVYTWLPATPEHTGMFNIAVPAGFRQVAPPAANIQPRG